MQTGAHEIRQQRQWIYLSEQQETKIHLYKQTYHRQRLCCKSESISMWKLWGLSVQKWMSNIKIWQKNPGFSQAEEQNRKAHELITTEQGILLRMNRSIQVESAFGVIKQDFRFKRFLTRGKPKTETQFFLIAFAYNVEKLCNRINSNRFGRSLFEKIIA